MQQMSTTCLNNNSSLPVQKVPPGGKSSSFLSKEESLSSHRSMVEAPISTTTSSMFPRHGNGDMMSFGSNNDSLSYHSNMPANSADIIICNPKSSTKSVNDLHDGNTGHTVSCVNSTVSSTNTQCYITPLEKREMQPHYINQNENQKQHHQYHNRNVIEPPPLMPRPVPFTPVQAAPPPLPQRTAHEIQNFALVQTQNTNNLPFLPPKQHQPPPYRAPPVTKNLISGLSQPGPMEPSRTPSLISNNQMMSPTNRLLMMPPIEEDVSYMSQEPLITTQANNSKAMKQQQKVASTYTSHNASQVQSNSFSLGSETFQQPPSISVPLAVPNNLSSHGFPTVQGSLLAGVGCGSSDGGGSHDSHNDSGYCVGSSSAGGRFGSGGPSPSLSGKYRFTS